MTGRPGSDRTPVRVRKASSRGHMEVALPASTGFKVGDLVMWKGRTLVKVKWAEEKK